MELLNSSIVVTAQGFTPQAVSESTFSDLLPSPPKQLIALPPIAVIDFPDGYHVVVEEEKIQIRRDNPETGSDPIMQRAILDMLDLWPLVKPKAIGLNFQFFGPYDENLSQENLIETLTDKSRVEGVLGSPLLGSRHVYVVDAHGARARVTIVTDSLVRERLGFVTEFNFHYESPGSPSTVVEKQSLLTDEAQNWTEGLVHGTRNDDS